MGCSFARSQRSELTARVFRVYNVDDQGAELSQGKIEVGDTDLILYQKGKDAIRWPLRCLRRYGFDAELFSFESGRRCATGPGIYAFKSRNAEALFNMVQECILRAGQDDTTRVSHNIFSGTSRSNSRPHSITDTHETYGIIVNGRNNSLTGSYGNGPLYVNGDIIQRNSREYMNTNTVNLHTQNGLDETSALIDFLHNPNLNHPQEPPVNYAVLDLPRSNENLNEAGRMGSESNSHGGMAIAVEDISFNDSVFLDGADGGCPEYMNIAPEALKAASRDSTVLKRDHNYANLSLNGDVVSNNYIVSNNNNNVEVLNYIQLDLTNQTDPMTTSVNSPSTFNSAPDSPRRKTESYAMIDFHRMAALSNTTKTVDLSDGPHIRKTRHNSTIGDIS